MHGTVLVSCAGKLLVVLALVEDSVVCVFAQGGRVGWAKVVKGFLTANMRHY